jgi:hypothetical protein
MEQYTDLQQYTSEFKEYWLNGFSPMIGKDGILPVPDIYADNAIGRAHVEPQVKSNITYSSSDEAWRLWSIDDDPTIPTSNSFLIYCVDDQRGCCLLAYLDAQVENSHELLVDPIFRKKIRVQAEAYFTAKKVFPMPKEEHEGLFSDVWIRS